METIKLGIAKEILSERDLNIIKSSWQKIDIESARETKIHFDKQKEWIEESIFLAIKEKGLISFKLKIMYYLEV